MTGTQVRIEGAGERYIQQGSILAVTCTADHPSGWGPQAVVWYRGAARLDYDSPRGGIALQASSGCCVLNCICYVSDVCMMFAARWNCMWKRIGFK